MTANESPLRLLSLVDEEPVPIAGGKLQWVPLRRRLGIRAFGTNAYRAARAGGSVVEEHVESPGQEELYVVVAGRARFTVDAEQVDVPAGSVVFVPQPEVRRGAVALEDGTVVLVIGGWPDREYHSLPWEPIYLAQGAMAKGDWAGAAETLEREAGEHSNTAIVQYRLACCHAEAGAHELALKALRRAIDINPDIRERAATDEHLAALRGLAGWSAATE